jgi:2-polyprenyl-6-methoxyphenol hydroxylase-like FAD-dependent oxidoreductase
MVDTTQVLVVGAGPVGLALATELGQRGVRTLVVERADRVGQQPRAKTTNVRSMEHMRRWGLAEAVRAAAPLPGDYPTDIIFATRLFGPEIAHFENAFYARRERNELFSEPAQWIPQYKIEAALRDHVLTLNSVSLHMSTELTGFAEGCDGVVATVRSGATAREIFAEYVVGADGARSLVRRGLGLKLEGEYGFAQNCGVVFRAPGLLQKHPHRPGIMYWLVNPESPGVIGPMDTDETWYFIMPMPGGFGSIGEAEARSAILRAIGREQEIEILTIDPWLAHSLIADGYGRGRVFLAGDACHLHPPFGGYGMNLGIGDAVDLGWKLAARLQGWGGAALLASYEAERRPVHFKVVEEAVANNALLSQHLIRQGMEEPGAVGEALRAEIAEEILKKKVREFRTLGVVLGIPYENSPVVVGDGSAPPEWHFSDYRPSASPGCLAPHLWLADGRSLYDCFGRDFSLLVTGPGAAADIAEFRRAAERVGVPIKVVEPGDERLAGLYGAGLALIRPDQHVAWRGDAAGGHAEDVLQIVTGARLGQPGDREVALAG